MTSILIDRLDGLSSAAAIKGPCKVATTANITLSGLQTIDGVSVVANDRVLVKDQTTGSQNGIYVADTGPWRRAKDFSRTKDVVEGTAVYVTDGTAHSQTLWVVATNNPIVVGTTSIAFELFIDVQAAFRFSLRSFGAKGNGTDDTAAINTALAAGVPLTGGGLTYGVTGKISLPANANLWDATFKQLAPGASLSVITLEGDTVSGLDLRRVKVDRNGDGTNGGLLDASGTNGALSSAFGMVFDACSNCHFEDLEVYGDDSGTGILFREIGESSRIIRPYVHDMDWVRTAATDDQVQGIWFDLCTRVEVWGPKVINLRGTLNGVASRRYTRGIVTGGCNGVRFLAPYVETVDQGIDITGATGGPNVAIKIFMPVVKDCYIFGVKLANTARRCVVSQGLAQDCGGAGYVISGNSAYALAITTDRNIIDLCIARDTGSNGQTVVATTAGFLVQSDATEAGSGARTRFSRCLAEDTQGSPTMDYGFASSVPLSYGSMFDDTCESIGHAVAATNNQLIRTGVVGTVSQTSNYPTGDIIERSTGGANGDVVKFADGTMRCIHTIDISADAMTTARGSSFGVSAAITWTFPATFVAAPKVSPTFRRNDITAPGSANVMTVSTTSATLNVISAASIGAGNAKFIDVVANGRWY